MCRGDRRAARVHGAAPRPVSVDAVRRGGARRAAAGVGGRTTGGAAAAGGRSGCRAVILPPGGLLRLRDGRPSVIAAGRLFMLPDERCGGRWLRRPCGWAAVRCERGLPGGRFVRSRRCMPPVYAAGRAVRGPEGCCAILRATKKPTSGNEGRLFFVGAGACVPFGGGRSPRSAAAAGAPVVSVDRRCGRASIVEGGRARSEP